MKWDLTSLFMTVPMYALAIVFVVFVAEGTTELVIGVVGVTVTVAIIALVHGKLNAARAETRRIWTEGTPATARVLTVRDAGTSGQGDARVALELEVTVAGNAPYRTRVDADVSLVAIPRVQPGCEIVVRIDPADRDHLVIDSELTPYGYG